jgi:hypothetical protein
LTFSFVVTETTLENKNSNEKEMQKDKELNQKVMNVGKEENEATYIFTIL